MTIAEYLEGVKERLLTDAIVQDFEIVRERATEADGYLRARLKLNHQQALEFSEYVQRTADGSIQVVTYSYHWSDALGQLLIRWDNTPHYPTLFNFPHHLHRGTQDTVEPSETMNIIAVLDFIVSAT